MRIAARSIPVPADTLRRLASSVRARDRQVPFVLMTAYSTVQSAVEAMRLGAFDYVEKPFDLPTLAATVQRNLAMQRAMAS